MFVFIACWKRIFLGATKFGGHKDYLEENWEMTPNANPWLRACLLLPWKEDEIVKPNGIDRVWSIHWS